MQRKRAAVLAAVAALAATRAALAQQPAPAQPNVATTAPATRPADNGNAARSIGTTVPELVATLNSPDAIAASRLEAARRLVARQSDASREAVRQLFTGPVNVQTRIAIVRALADDLDPDPQLLPALIGLLDDPNERLAEFVPAAVAIYRGDGRVVNELARVGADAARRVPTRAAALRALGHHVEQPAAAALVRVITTPAEPPEVIAAASEALIDMTGLELNGSDPAKWDQWQRQNAARPPAEWKDALFATRTRRDARLRRGAEATVDETQVFLQEQYTATPGDRQGRMLMRLLQSGAPALRQIGARIAEKVSTRELGSGQVPADVQQRLVELIADADPGVRLDAVLALYNLNIDPTEALGAMLPQLRVETDPDVKVAIARKLSQIQRIDQVDDLTRLLDDPSPAVVREAAEALRRRAPAIVQQDKAMATQTAQRLRAAMQRLAGRPNFVEARRACGEALAPLRDPGNIAFARELIRQSEPALIRGVGLLILGEMGPQVSEIIVRDVDDEPDPKVRVEGVKALGRTGSFDQSPWLIQKMNPRGGAEPSQEVRAGARDAYIVLLDSASDQRLASEAGQRKNDPPLRIAVLKKLVEKLKAAEKLEDAAIQQQNIGAEYLNNLNQPAEAYPHLREALEYWRGKGSNPAVTAVLIPQVISAMLKNQQYTPLATLAQDLIAKSPENAGTYQQAFGSKMRNEAENLLDNKQFDRAAALVDAALRMNPPLDESYRNDIRRIGQQVEVQRRADAPR